MITINCNYDEINKCMNCKHKTNCSLLEPTTKNYTLLLKEINYYLNEWRTTKKHIKEYIAIFDEINNNKYCIPVNVYGTIKYAPKQNVFGVFIRKPEHIYYGCNLNKLKKYEKELFEKIRILRQKELNMRNILKRR